MRTSFIIFKREKKPIKLINSYSLKWYNEKCSYVLFKIYKILNEKFAHFLIHIFFTKSQKRINWKIMESIKKLKYKI